MENSISHIGQLPETKAEIKSFVNNIISELEGGAYCPLTVAVKFQAIEKLVKEIKADDRFKELTVNEAYKHSKSFDYSNAKIEIANVGTKYDYSVCNDDVYNDLKAQEAQLKDMIKARETMLKTGINPETGEEFQLPLKTSTENIKITLK